MTVMMTEWSIYIHSNFYNVASKIHGRLKFLGLQEFPGAPNGLKAARLL